MVQPVFPESTLSSEQAAEILGVSPGTLANWRVAKRGPVYIKCGLRKVRYRLADVERWLDQNAVKTIGW